MKDDWLDRALREAESPLDDDGFTLRVMSALPAPRSARSSGHDWIVIAGAAVGSTVVASQFPLAPFLNVVLQAAQITWIGGAVMLACMAGALLAEPIRRIW
jgi:hypothetical protein